MAIPIELNPVELLEHVTTKQYRPKPRPTAVSDAAIRGFLSSAVRVQLPAAVGPRAAINGYALGAAEVETGCEIRVLGSVDARGRARATEAATETATATGTATATALEPALDPGARESDAAGPGVWRVETGDPLPECTDRVLPVRDATLVGSARIRVERVPAPGAGVAAPTTAGTLAAGTPYSARTRAWLLAGGVEKVDLRPPFTVAFGVIGDELTDSLVTQEASGGTSVGANIDLNGLWLAEDTAQLGLAPQAVGILRDDEAEIGAVLRRLRRRDIHVLIVSGGIGDGIRDRTVEALRRAGGGVRATGIDIDQHWPFVFAKCDGVDVYGLPGDPFRAAACFDLLVRPALLAALGAGAEEWDWTRSRCVLPSSPAASCWSIRPARMVGGRIDLLPILERVPFHPDQTGWVVVAPAAREAYYVALS